MITRAQIRAVMGDGAQVVDSAGSHLGRITDVVLGAQTSQPAWMTVDCVSCTGSEVVVPLSRARLLDGCVQVPYTATDVCGAPRATGPAGHLGRRQTAELGRYYDSLDGGTPALPRLRADGDSAIGTASAWPASPVSTTNGHGRTNAAPLVPVLPLPGLAVTGSDGPAASSAPWPPASTPSPGSPWSQRRQWRWPSVSTSIRAMRLELRPFLDVTGLPDEELDDLVLAAAEAAANAVEHARRTTLPCFDVLAEVGENWARIVVQDHGQWREPAAPGDRGRGLRMISVLADATLTVRPRGTTVVLRSRPVARG